MQVVLSISLKHIGISEFLLHRGFFWWQERVKRKRSKSGAWYGECSWFSLVDGAPDLWAESLEDTGVPAGSQVSPGCPGPGVSLGCSRS